MTLEVACWAERSFRIDPGNTALLVIDAQNDFVADEGMSGQLGNDLRQIQAAVPNIVSLRDAARAAEVPVIYTREGHEPDLSDMPAVKRQDRASGDSGPLGRFLVKGERGHAIVDALTPAEGEPVFDKYGYSVFYRTDLEGFLRDRGISHLIAVGFTTQCCVLQAVREGTDRGFWCLTVADACGAVEQRHHDASLDMIQSEGHLFGWIADTDSLRAAFVALAT